MEAVILSQEQFKFLQDAIDEIKLRMVAESKKPAEQYVDNQEFLILMKISKRTAQMWRDENKISFSQIGNKIYYKVSDVEDLLNNHYIKSSKRGGSHV